MLDLISWFYFLLKFQISVPVCCEVAIETNKIIFVSFISLFYQQLFIANQKYNTPSSKSFKFLKFSSMRGHHLLNTSAIGYWCRPLKMEASRFRLMKPHFDATVKKTDFVFGLIDALMEYPSRWNIWNIPDHIICHKLWPSLLLLRTHMKCIGMKRPRMKRPYAYGPKA